jgi:hypothetical protein
MIVQGQGGLIVAPRMTGTGAVPLSEGKPVLRRRPHPRDEMFKRAGNLAKRLQGDVRSLYQNHNTTPVSTVA